MGDAAGASWNRDPAWWADGSRVLPAGGSAQRRDPGWPQGSSGFAHGDPEDRAADRLLGPAAVHAPEVLERIILCAGSMRYPTGVRARAMLTTLRYTGLRASELLALRPADVQQRSDGEAMLLVRGKGARSRLVPLHPSALTALDTWARWREVYAPGARFTFPTISQPNPGRRLERDYLWRVVRRAANRAGYADLRAHPHMFRASLAVELSRAGVPVAVIRDLLGHGNLATTDAYLRRVDPGDVRRAVELVP